MEKSEIDKLRDRIYQLEAEIQSKQGEIERLQKQIYTHGGENAVHRRFTVY